MTLVQRLEYRLPPPLVERRDCHDVPSERVAAWPQERGMFDDAEELFLKSPLAAPAANQLELQGLLYAVAFGEEAEALMLINSADALNSEAKVQLDVKDSTGRTALHCIIIGSVPICMSGQRGLVQVLRGLIEAVWGLATEVRLLRDTQDPPAQNRPSEASSTGEWELVEEQSAVPGAPTGFNSTIRFEAESGVPPTPAFLVSLALKRLRSSKEATEERAREAFCAGYWYRIGLKCSVPLTSHYKPALPPAHWLVQSGSEICNIARTTTRREADVFVAQRAEARIIEAFPSLTELQIFCAGAQIFVPALLRWKSEN
eukprot:s4510_g7.t1